MSDSPLMRAARSGMTGAELLASIQGGSAAAETPFGSSVTDLHSRRAAAREFHVCAGINRKWRVVDTEGRSYGEFGYAATAMLLRDLLIQGATSGDASASSVTA